MRITGFIQKALAPQRSPDSAQGSPASAVSSPAPSSDQVQLSGMGAQLAQSLSTRAAANVSELADAVSAGQYHPDSLAIGNSIIEHAVSAAA
jgi:anti-sigma28 factor (negative regulator of flagellin synthesis)